MIRIEIDLNIRVRGNQTYAGYENVSGALPAIGDHVEVFESESGLVGSGIVVELDDKRQIVYLDVDWATLR